MRATCKIPIGLDIALGELGISLADVLTRAGLPRALVREQRPEVSIADYLALWRTIEDVADRPAIGLAIGSRAKPDALEPVFLAVLASESYGDALARISRYKRVLCAEDVTVDRDGDEVIVRYHGPDEHHRVPDVLVDTELAFLLNLGRRGAGRPIEPIAVHFRRARLTRPALYESFFRCPLAVGQPHNGIVFPAEAMDYEFVTFNRPLLQLIEPQLRARAAQVEQQRSTSSRVGRAVVELLAGSRPTLQDIAKRLAVSRRTLQRQLRSEGTTFAEVLNQSRKQLAQTYLDETAMAPAEIAFLLGYEDANSFYRAFRTWTGQTPRGFRLRPRTATS